MLELNKDAKPLIVTDNGKDVQVGWRMEMRDFTFDAIVQEDESVNTYVEWGDDQGIDITNHTSMSEAKRWLDTLLQTSRR